MPEKRRYSAFRHIRGEEFIFCSSVLHPAFMPRGGFSLDAGVF
jgi:hypothetical protein